MTKDFIARLTQEAMRKKSHVCVGIDPDLRRLPAAIKAKALKEYGNTREAVSESLFAFSKDVIDAVKDYAIAVKLQIAWFEKYGHLGVKALERVRQYSQECGLLTLVDAKRGDVGVTANAYAQGFLGDVNLYGETVEPSIHADAITLNSYLGRDSIEPFLQMMKAHQKGAFILVKTTNPSSKDIQDLILKSGQPLYEHVASLVAEWGKVVPSTKQPYNNLGAVVGATFPEAAGRIRKLMPSTYFLVPGLGAQGGRPEDLAAFFNDDGLGALASASRSIIYAYEKKEEAKSYLDPIREATLTLRDSINSSLASMKKICWE